MKKNYEKPQMLEYLNCEDILTTSGETDRDNNQLDTIDFSQFQ